MDQTPYQFKKSRFLTCKNSLSATGGTVDCVVDILKTKRKEITGLSVVIELKDLVARSKFDFPVESQFS